MRGTDSTGWKERLRRAAGKGASAAVNLVAPAKADPQHFKDIRLGVARIWKARTDGIWLYVEQAAAESLDKPYRQRVYHLRSLGDGRFQSEIYSLKGNPLRLAGAWRQVAPLADLGIPSEARDLIQVDLFRPAPGLALAAAENNGCGVAFGIDVDLVQIRGNVAIAAALSGQVHASNGVGTVIRAMERRNGTGLPGRGNSGSTSA